MSSTIKVNNIQNLAGDDSGFDLSTNDKIGMKIANSEVVTVDTTGVVLNEGSADRDFRVESNGQANMLLVDGGNDTVSFQPNSGTLTIKAGSGDATNNVRLEAGGTTSTFLEYRGFLGHQFYVDTTERMRIDSNGHLMLSTATARTGTNSITLEGGNSFFMFRATGTGSLQQASFFRNTDATPTQVGSIFTSSVGTSYNQTSDYRLKENVNYSFDATTRLKKLKPARFNFIIDADTTVDGFLAHEVSDIVPEAITGEKDAVDADGNIDPQGIDHSKLVPLLTKALQEQQATIEALEARITALEGK